MQNIGWTVQEAGPYMGANGNLKHLDKLGFKKEKISKMVDKFG
jgi:hypothetical protein